MERKTFFLSLTQRRHYTKHSSNNSTYLYHSKSIILQFYLRCRFVVYSLCIRSIYTFSVTGQILSIYTKTWGIILKIQYNSPCFILVMSDYFFIISCRYEPNAVLTFTTYDPAFRSLICSVCALPSERIIRVPVSE